MSNQTTTTTTTTSLYCANHPNVETSLRCSRCEKPICIKCAVRTPTGYRCRECVRGQQKLFETAQWYDYLLGFTVTVVLSFIGSRIVPALGFFTIFLAPIAGMVIAEAARFTVRNRRSKRLFQLITVAAVLGSLPILLMTALTVLGFMSRGGLGLLLGLVWQGLYTFIVTSTVYYRMSGIQMRT